ncbi:DUF418 domain-containing protein [Sphingomonas sp. SM33]|uniref:DUF418 domain-containing protein n=1 Tax=Sphingomonas telluris TaxID=2907998 RepID=A0ABS9VMS1_9SPHN|nr:DUF418 domain-containing protein [Sphingomonas telluris]MCH8616271.1 DUF418 domain-containing protein [Sphingomonas telluris]
MTTETIARSDRRIVTLDVIRGVAVMGILSVNIVDFSMMQAAYLNPAAFGWPDPASLAVWIANMLFVDGKFRTLFSVLFGASMLLIIDRAERRGESGWTVHWRRMAVLLVIGAAHAILLWRGDILTLYAITGLIAFPFRKLATEKLVAAGLSFSLFNLILFAAIGVTLLRQDVQAHAANADPLDRLNWELNLSSFYPPADDVAEDRAVYGGPWTGIVKHQAGEATDVLTNDLLLLPDTLGLMLLGMAGLRSGFLTGAWDDRDYWRIVRLGIPIGLAGFGALVIVDIASRFYMPTLLTGFESLMVPFRLAMASGYAALLILLSRNMGWIVQRFAAVGRAAFSNYLGTSFVCTFIFYGWGLGWYGKLTRAEAWLVVPFVWLLMLLWSKPWLDRFRYGPFEWLWRSLARLEFQPMRKSGREAAA